ncbi:MAG: DEAD/DEAH box helicase family protein [Candidatus Nitrosotenuis sp.]
MPTGEYLHMFKLRKYQEKYTNELKDKVNDFLDSKSNKICVFKAPTGSGKTIMMAEFIKRLVENRHDYKEIAFIWITVHKLHEQSKEKLEKYYEDLQTIICSVFEDLQDKQIQDREILFFNWQSINQENNIYIREGENDNNLSRIIENTKEAGREIILIIDESHHTASSEKSLDIIRKIGPKVTIEVSATPHISNIDHLVNVDLQEVKDEEMIKKFIMLNHGLGNVKASTTDELIIKTALEKRQQLKRNYEKEGSNVNPLVLVQLPDSRAGTLDRKDEIIKILDSRFGINTENGKLAIYLSDKDNKVNLENIEKNDNEVEVLIFKQAIAIGWDCPRSSILVLFREWKKFEFSIQTIGRIIRMPEIKHYENEELNNAYVYTNIDDIHIAEDVTKDYITIYESARRDEIYANIDLKSVYIKRKHEKTRLTGKFTEIFLEVARKDLLSEKISLEPIELKNRIMIDGRIEQLDKEQVVEATKSISINTSPLELQNRFDLFLRDCSEGFAPVHSSERIRRSLYSFFEQNTDKVDLVEIQRIILSSSNRNHFIGSINRAKDRFRKEIVEKVEREIEENIVWNVPESTEYTKIYEERKFKKCIMKPAYIKTDNQYEIDFMNFLDRDDNQVKWWFKNGESDKKYFAIQYTDPEDNQMRAFYLDFIFQMHDGRIGLFDTKGGITAVLAKPKAKALAEYIARNKHKNLFGGIVNFSKNTWLYNDDINYSYKPNNLSGWKMLEL